MGKVNNLLGSDISTLPKPSASFRFIIAIIAARYVSPVLKQSELLKSGGEY